MNNQKAMLVVSGVLEITILRNISLVPFLRTKRRDQRRKIIKILYKKLKALKDVYSVYCEDCYYRFIATRTGEEERDRRLTFFSLGASLAVEERMLVTAVVELLLLLLVVVAFLLELSSFELRPRDLDRDRD
jgi:hypothetical protein